MSDASLTLAGHRGRNKSMPRSKKEDNSEKMPKMVFYSLWSKNLIKNRESREGEPYGQHWRLTPFPPGPLGYGLGPIGPGPIGPGPGPHRPRLAVEVPAAVLRTSISIHISMYICIHIHVYTRTCVCICICV